MFVRSRPLCAVAQRTYSQVSAGGAKPTSTPSAAPSGGINTNVPGLSSNIVKPASGKLGPGASHDGDYKVPEYYSFNRFSYAEAEVEMAKYRLPQPSAKK